jgi:mono/diheme cytochrome c family protein
VGILETARQRVNAGALADAIFDPDAAGFLATLSGAMRAGYHYAPPRRCPFLRMSLRILSLTVATAVIAIGGARAETREVTFERDVRPILKAHCTHCHGEEEKPKGGVDLRLRRFMDKVLDEGGHVLVPGQPDQSEMVLLIREGEMPKKGKKVSPEELAVIERWIAQGAKVTKPEPESLAPGMFITDADSEFWSFKPVAKVTAPTIENAARVRTPIDAFVLARLREQHLDFAPDADKRTLLRRVTLDLTGLLPTRV